MTTGTTVFTYEWRRDLAKLITGRTAIFMVTEPLRVEVGDDWGTDVSIISLPEGESQKSWIVVQELMRKLEEISFPRDGMIVGIGGGATTDVVGFVASLWMRGVDWIAIPTTLAGMVDAAIGGKTGINGLGTKNLIGSFHLPVATIVDQRFLHSLPDRDLKAGVAEIIKCGFISDSQILDLAKDFTFTDSDSLSQSSILNEMIERAIAVKERIVSRDLKESGERAYLNYGHTLGHAIEKEMDYGLRHGEAVAIGMVFAACLSKVVHGLPDAMIKEHVELLQKFDLPVALPDIDSSSLVGLMWRDKKVKNQKLRFVTLRSVGDPVLIEVDEDQLQQAFMEQARWTGEQ